MTNEQKYKTPEERTKALNEFCLGYTDCKRDGRDCPCLSLSGNCAYNWLTLEAEEEKPLPCPFCDYPSPYLHNDGERWLVDCGACGAQIFRATRESAVAAWNRRAK